MDLRKRYDLTLNFSSSVDTTIGEHVQDIFKVVQGHWSNHKCDKPGCSTVLVIDG